MARMGAATIIIAILASQALQGAQGSCEPAGSLGPNPRPPLAFGVQARLRAQGGALGVSMQRCERERRAPPPVDRRLALQSLGGAGLASAQVLSPNPVRAEEEGELSATDEQLLERLSSTKVTRAPGGGGFFADKQLYWPTWMFGEWDVTASLRPAGAQGGSIATYQQRYFSTLADTFDNALRVQLGLGVPSAEIIEDRVFNLISAATAQGQRMRPVGGVYDPRIDPTLVTLGMQSQEGGKQGTRRVQYTGRAGGKPRAASSPLFLCSESVRLDDSEEGVCEYDVVTRLALGDDGSVEGTRRVAVFRPFGGSASPSGEAVQVLDYKLSFKRRRAADGSVCVDTPKGYTQCQPPDFWRL